MKTPTVDPLVFQGLDAIRLGLADGSEAIVTLAGAHLVSWHTADGAQQLYLSPHSPMATGQAIRGGVPVIFPQFSTRGNLGRHGFARNSTWERDGAECTGDTASVRLGLRGDCNFYPGWPHTFACVIQVTLGPGSLAVELQVSNRGEADLVFCAALHTYLRITGLKDTRLSGLQGCSYEDTNDGGARKQDLAPTLQPDGPIDRIYMQTPAVLHLMDAQRTLALQSEGFTDTVVWNPGEAGCSRIADLPPKDFDVFLCVEAAAIETPVRLGHGQAWTGLQRLRVL